MRERERESERKEARKMTQKQIMEVKNCEKKNMLHTNARHQAESERRNQNGVSSEANDKSIFHNTGVSVHNLCYEECEIAQQTDRRDTHTHTLFTQQARNNS